jgi:glutathione S-transferase
VRSTYGPPGFAQHPHEVGASDASPAEKQKGQKAAAEAVGETLTAFHKFFLDGKTFVGG